MEKIDGPLHYISFGSSNTLEHVIFEAIGIDMVNINVYTNSAVILIAVGSKIIG